MSLSHFRFYLKEHGKEFNKEIGGNSEELIKQVNRILSDLEKLEKTIRAQK